MTASYHDREAIRELTARYNFAADAKDLEGFADCFVEDGVFEAVGQVRLQGREALKGLIAGLTFPTLHVTADAVVDVDGDTARQQACSIIYGRNTHENDVRVVTIARCTDRFVRTAKGWRFIERMVTAYNDLGIALAELS